MLEIALEAAGRARVRAECDADIRFGQDVEVGFS
jgi:hypothetical protein